MEEREQSDSVCESSIKEETVPTAVWLAKGSFVTEKHGDLQVRLWCSQGMLLEPTKWVSSSKGFAMIKG